MPKYDWTKHTKKYRRRGDAKPNASRQVQDAWASFDRITSGSVLPRDIVSEAQSLADARRPTLTKKQRKRIAKQQARKQRAQKQPPKPTKPVPSKQPKSSKRIWVENYEEYLKSPHWLAKRKEAQDHYGRKCADCGAEHSLEVHHKTYRRIGREKMKDLDVLCGPCHRLRHKDKQVAVVATADRQTPNTERQADEQPTNPT